MNGFDLLKQVSEVSDRVEKAREFIRGGPLTDILELLGDLHYRSAIEHLEQARYSTDPEDRLTQAAGELQTAFFAFQDAAGRGIQKLRFVFDSSMTESRARACGSASTIALIQWSLDESPRNRRQWVDRAARHLADHCRLVRDWGVDDYFWAELGMLTHYLQAYFKFERNVLPDELVRPVPPLSLPELNEWKPGSLIPPLPQQLIGPPLGKRDYTDDRWLPSYDHE